MCTCVAFMYILKVYLSVYVYIRVYIYIYTYIQLYIYYICMYICMYICTHAYSTVSSVLLQIEMLILCPDISMSSWSISSSNQNTEFQPGSLNLMLRTIKSPDYSDYSDFSGM